MVVTALPLHPDRYFVEAKVTVGVVLMGRKCVRSGQVGVAYRGCWGFFTWFFFAPAIAQ